MSGRKGFSDLESRLGNHHTNHLPSLNWLNDRSPLFVKYGREEISQLAGIGSYWAVTPREKLILTLESRTSYGSRKGFSNK